MEVVTCVGDADPARHVQKLLPIGSPYVRTYRRQCESEGSDEFWMVVDELATCAPLEHKVGHPADASRDAVGAKVLERGRHRNSS